MERMEGVTISTGLVKGIAVVVGYKLQRTFTSNSSDERGSILRADVQAECERMDGALEKSKQDLNLFTTIASDKPSLSAAVELMSVHVAMASEIANLAKEQISCNLVGVEDALDSVINKWVIRLQEIDNDYLQEREMDVRDVGQRMMRHLIGIAPTQDVEFPHGAIVVARELVPSDAIALANSGVVGIVTQFGGKFGHTAIIARSLGIPAVSGIANVTQQITSGMTLLVDGEAGIVTAEPTQDQEGKFDNCMAAQAQLQTTREDSDEVGSCQMMDGTEVLLFGNVGLQEDLDQTLRHGLTGVGLFRTEFLYLKSQTRPDTESQLSLYSQMAERLGDRPLVIRTFDLGGDKVPPFLSLDPLIAPLSLNLRGLRFSLVEPELLREQLTAIVQVAQFADVRILFPMVIGGHDFGQAITIVEEVMNECDALKRPQIGAMIETPAALFCLDEIMEIADFIAIGTNDLTHYLLAADRELSAEDDSCTAMHPAVLRAIHQIMVAAQRWDRPTCVCGEEAGESEFAELMIGLGVRELSVCPARATDLHTAISSMDVAVAGVLAERALACQSPDEVRKLLSSVGRSEYLAKLNQPSSNVPRTNP